MSDEFNEAWEYFKNGIIEIFKVEEILKWLEKKLGGRAMKNADDMFKELRV